MTRTTARRDMKERRNPLRNGNFRSRWKGTKFTNASIYLIKSWLNLQEKKINVLKAEGIKIKRKIIKVLFYNEIIITIIRENVNKTKSYIFALHSIHPFSPGSALSDVISFKVLKDILKISPLCCKLIFLFWWLIQGSGFSWSFKFKSESFARIINQTAMQTIRKLLGRWLEIMAFPRNKTNKRNGWKLSAFVCYSLHTLLWL